jgi:cellulose synthase/poly-beta-1,6-N-acetylglucosamine synthase-like glycosyltransferase
MLAAEPIVELLLTLGLILLAMSSLNLVALVLARLLMPTRRLVTTRPTDEQIPTVLVQLPLFNEGELVDRVLEAAAALDWPRDRLQIQVLDDSTDAFSLSLGQRAVARLRREGIQIDSCIESNAPPSRPVRWLPASSDRMLSSWPFSTPISCLLRIS